MDGKALSSKEIIHNNINIRFIVQPLISSYFEIKKHSPAYYRTVLVALIKTKLFEKSSFL